MTFDARQKANAYRVIINDEEQYSLWPIQKAIPNGWSDAGFAGSEQECMDHVEAVWLDLRPRSLRESLRVAEAATDEVA